ncbi:zinc-dependent metalloprotease [Sphingobium phenoxybenzoativorans]|uniref:Zinc-dependent metalloprotease n=1 Tax=Sphingobium phenoxybenzoativorans TaxID=1592790 RepID=A0A975K666_9SPHN|nr:zinc-dependent metalloprotease [Sphingobium phenoxybenzoativorans]QUT05535.1 zinc-dependent metalloprotease [Sphingobium phenoxybenzoativorans]
MGFPQRAFCAASWAVIAFASLGAGIAQAEPVDVRTSSDGVLLPVKADMADGRVLLTLPPADAQGVSGRFLYTAAIKTGLGSAPIRIDRGMQGDTQILAFRRLGKKMAITYENPRYRAIGDADIQKGATGSFPFSTMAMVDIVSTAAGGAVTIDIAPFLTSDTMKLADALNSNGKGFKLAESLSATDPGSVKVFPDNIEMEAIQTFVSDTPGEEVDTIAPDGRRVSFTVHHSLIRLPAPGFRPRKFDIRSGAHATQAYDFTSKLGDPVMVQFANHFRLDKLDPAAPRSRVRKPIVFYIDNAAPEPIRTALAEGVGWWSQAFDAAGYIDAFQVKILPPGVDPQDVRYNVVNWTNRQTRSWSYGGGIIDPRTGEFIKGNVVLGSLRLRQDILIFEALAGTAQNDSNGPNDAVRIALARIRQLGAHEVGHAIGFSHNFAASLDDRASVMDYPAPLVKIVDGKLDLGDAYAVGIGAWDKFTVDWLYGQPMPGVDPDEDAARKAAKIAASGARYMTDIDGRASDLAVPGVNMWTEGADQPADLAHILQVRKIAIANFGPNVLKAGEPLSDLRRKFVPVWLFHRYAVAAIGKVVGGVNYHYAVVGDGTPSPTTVAAADQRAALDALIGTLSADVLTVGPDLTLALSSGVNGRSDPQFDTEVFANAGASVFDPLVAADVAAQLTLESLLAPSRLSRVYAQYARDPAQLGLSELFDRLQSGVIDRHSTAVERRIAQRTILSIAKARRSPATSVDVAVILDERLRRIADQFSRAKGKSEDVAWQHGIAALLNNESALAQEISKGSRPEPVIPPGMPIGGETGWFDENI